MFGESAPKTDTREELIHNPEKARLMAEMEADGRELATNLKAYMDNPIAFSAEERAWVSEVAAEGSFTANETETYRLLYNAGVRPQNLIDMAREEGEHAGKLFELKRAFQDVSVLILKITDRGHRMREARAQKKVDESLAEAEKELIALVGDENLFARDILLKVNPTGSEAIERYAINWHNYTAIGEIREAVREELERRARAHKKAA